MTIDLTDYDHGISALDSGFHRPRLDAIHLMVQGGHAAIIDTATTHSVPLVQEALAAKGLTTVTSTSIRLVPSCNITSNLAWPTCPPTRGKELRNDLFSSLLGVQSTLGAMACTML